MLQDVSPMYHSYEIYNMSIVIAIDGYSSTGKSTIAKRLAEALDYIYIDTGAMYRMVALYSMQAGWVSDGRIDKDALVAALDQIELSFVHDASGENVAMLNGLNVELAIRSMAVSQVVSAISSISAVRQKLVAQQQSMGQSKAVVLDGRDIGTVVFPEAELKIFMTADSDVRASRRHAELQAKGQSQVTLSAVRDNLLQRDEADQARSDSPLLQAKDARLLDNSTITPDEVFQVALSWAKLAIEGKA
jgi:cytidylate kinase